MYLDFNGKQINYTLTKQNVHIQDSYAITSKTEMLAILSTIRLEAAKNDIFYNREDDSWLAEWCAHNRLHKLGIAKRRTGSVDLDENESKIRLLLYPIIALGY